MLIQNAVALDSVNAVDGGVEGILILLTHIQPFDESGHIEVELGKHQAHRLDQTGDDLLFLELLILDQHHALIPHGYANIPQPIYQRLSVARLNIIEFFIGDQHVYLWTVGIGHAAVDNLVQNRNHLIFAQGAAFQKNLADRKGLAVGQALGAALAQKIAFLGSVIDDLPRNALLCGSLGEETAEIVDIPLNRALRDTVTLGGIRLCNHITVNQAQTDV